MNYLALQALHGYAHGPRDGGGRACRGAHSKPPGGKARGPPSSPRPAPSPDAKPKMKKQSGYLYHPAQQREAARAAVEAEAPELSTQEKIQAVMKKLADMWNALDDAAKQKYSEDAPLGEVKERKKPAAAPAGHASFKAPMTLTAAPAEEVELPATMEGLDLPSKPTDWPKELGQAPRALGTSGPGAGRPPPSRAAASRSFRRPSPTRTSRSLWSSKAIHTILR